jgi:hypothetical protein
MSTQNPILSALEEQVGCYRRLARLAEAQHEHVQQSRTEELLEVLKRRQEVLEQIARLERVLAPARKDWTDYLGGLATSSRLKAEEHLSEARRLLEQITAADRDDAIVLQQRKLNIGRQINQAASAKQANRNYAAAAYGARRPALDVQK